MDSNPLNIPLRLDVCQQIHYAALRKAASETRARIVPNSVPLSQLRQMARSHGPAMYLLHPADIERIFSGVTTAVYQAIEQLYCDRLGRSIKTVWRILDRMARQDGKPSLDYEAVWAICLYLDEQRQVNTDVTIRRTTATWQIAQITPDIRIQDTPRPLITCVLDTDPSRVLAFRLVDNGMVDQSISLAIYDAIVSQRRPASDGAAGLDWPLPARLETAQGLSPGCQKACADIGIETEQTEISSDLLDALSGKWTRDLAGRIVAQDHFITLLDNYLEKVHEYGPLRNQELLAYKFIHRVGFNRDPAWQFPALRNFLPLRSVTVQEGGAVEYDGLHYEDSLLVYWVDQKVALRRSESAEAVAWVYLDDEILCQAMARELRRQDGSYRPNRPRR